MALSENMARCSSESIGGSACPKYIITHDGSMVLLYMVCHGSHQYTPFMLALIYQHHGSVRGNTSNISPCWVKKLTAAVSPAGLCQPRRQQDPALGLGLVLQGADGRRSWEIGFKDLRSIHNIDIIWLVVTGMEFYDFPYYIGNIFSQLTKSYFSEGLVYHQPDNRYIRAIRYTYLQKTWN